MSTDTAAKFYVSRVDRAGTVHGRNSYGATKVLCQVWKIQGGWKNDQHRQSVYTSQNMAARALQN